MENLLIAGLSSAYIVYLLVNSPGPYGSFDRLRKMTDAGIEDNPQNPFRCPFCLAIWVSIPITLLLEGKIDSRAILAGLAVAMVSSFIAFITAEIQVASMMWSKYVMTSVVSRALGGREDA